MLLSPNNGSTAISACRVRRGALAVSETPRHRTCGTNSVSSVSLGRASVLSRVAVDDGLGQHRAGAYRPHAHVMHVPDPADQDLGLWIPVLPHSCRSRRHLANGLGLGPGVHADAQQAVRPVPGLQVVAIVTTNTRVHGVPGNSTFGVNVGRV